uniref:Cns1/TTC4 wheel domain-containing protein n=1 Tax=Plectus sambesii TaxID=2011161 RepID=A0A914WBG3_9BILA
MPQIRELDDENEKKPKKDPAKVAQEMDEDLDRFMEELAANKARNPGPKKEFDFDEWAKELDSHPAFMNDLKPNESGEYSEAIQALQALKYDDENDPKDSAERYKLEGNKHFKFKKYRWAIDCYTNGIKAMCSDRQMNAVLYANRAAAQVRLGNKRSAIKDCVMARKFDAHHHKALLRGAECLLDLGYAAQCLKWIATCDWSNADQDISEKVEEVRRAAETKRAVEERDARKQKIRMEKDKKEKTKLLAALKARGMQFRPKIHFDDVNLFEWSDMQVELPQLDEHAHVYVGDGDALYWPLLLQYPEFAQTDFVKDSCESTPIEDILAKVLSTPAPWDVHHRYRLDNIRVFFGDEYMNQVISVPLKSTLGDVLRSEQMTIEHGLPVLQVYPVDYVNSHFECVHGNVWKTK